MSQRYPLPSMPPPIGTEVIVFDAEGNTARLTRASGGRNVPIVWSPEPAEGFAPAAWMYKPMQRPQGV